MTPTWQQTLAEDATEDENKPKETKNINSPGWDGLDATPNPNALIEPTELDKLYQRVFLRRMEKNYWFI